MKKILIISYFFPPSIFTGGFRVYSWAKYLSGFGYYPIIVTRNWDIQISEYKDMSESSTPEIIHEKFENHEVYYLPYKGNLRDKIYKKYGDDKMVFPRKILSFFEMLLQNFSTRATPFRNLFKFSDQLLKNDQEILCLITSVKPYVLLNFCRKLSKKYKLPWIADYRDDWNTSQWLINLNHNDKIILFFEKRSEKNWLRNSTCFTSVSASYVKPISEFIKRPGFVIMNGFDPDDYIPENKNISEKSFTILFSGSLYNNQSVEIFITAFKLFIKKCTGGPFIKLVFLGLNFEKKQAKRIQELLQGYEKYYEITDRIEKKAALEIMGKAQVFLMLSYNNTKGVTSSKLFDYLAIGKPILLCPTDNEILEEIINTTRSGFICNTSEQIYDTLINFYNEYKENGFIHYDPDKKMIESFSRKNQTYKLSAILDDIFSGELKNEALPEETSRVRKFSFTILNNKLLRSGLRKFNDSDSIIRLLCFHNISEKLDLSYPSLKPDLFYDIIKHLSKEYDIVPISSLQAITADVKRPVVLTFDDGYKNFIEYALPVLKEFNAPSLNNIIVDCVENNRPFWTQRLNYDISYIFRNYRKFYYKWEDVILKNEMKVSSPYQDSLVIYKKLTSFDQNRRESFLTGIEDKFNIKHPDNWELMNWQEILQCVQHGVEIGSHTMTHDSLTTIDDDNILNFEISDSKDLLEKRIGKAVNILAFPNGIYDDRCIEISANAGYKYLLTTHEKYFHKESVKEGLPLILPRISINSNDNNENFLRIENFHNIIKFKR